MIKSEVVAANIRGAKFLVTPRDDLVVRVVVVHTIEYLDKGFEELGIDRVILDTPKAVSV
ncbi:hypothetical protein [Halopiger aswanensis]|uniref:hypothetical protein n=1 Tax=Halopiger aswanensis TaxID=148449 RepID=UPI00147492BA|nr:hypothetical protein [Halopiger aswanensis]